MITGPRSARRAHGRGRSRARPCAGSRPGAGWKPIAATPASSTSRSGQLEALAVARLEPRAQLDGDRRPRRPPRAARAIASASSGSAEQRGAGAGLADLAHRAAHVDVDQVGAGLGDDRGRRAHHLGVLAEELDRDRVLVGVDPQQLAQGALVAVVQAEARDHLGDREAGAVAARLQADEPVADPGQRAPAARGWRSRRRRSRKGDVSGGCIALSVALVDQAEPAQGQQRIDLVDRLAERRDRRRPGRRWR